MKKEKNFTSWVHRRLLLRKWLFLKSRDILSSDIKGSIRREAFILTTQTMIDLSRLSHQLVVSPWCLVRCGSVCCYFPRNSKYGVSLDPGMHDEIIKTLARRGLKASDYIGQRTFKIGKKKVKIWYMKLKRRRIVSEKALSSAPELLSGGGIWTNKNSKACAFLKKGNSCLLYLSGIYPRTCIRFVCKTGSFVSVLVHLGYVSPMDLDCVKMSDVNRVAGKMDLFFSDRRLNQLDMEIIVKLMAVVDSFLGRRKNLQKRMRELSVLDAEYSARRDFIIARVLA